MTAPPKGVLAWTVLAPAWVSSGTGWLLTPGRRSVAWALSGLLVLLALALWRTALGDGLARWLGSSARTGRAALVLMGAALASFLVGSTWIPDPNTPLLLANLLAAPALVLGAWTLTRDRGRRRLLALAAGATFLGVGLRVVLLVAQPLPIASADTESYLNGAHALVLDGVFQLSERRTPVFPLLYAAVVQMGGLLPWRVVLASSGVLTAALAGLWFLRRGEPRSAALAYSLLVLDPRALVHETLLLPGVLLTLALLAAVLALLRGLRDSGHMGWLSLAGLLIGLAVLTKPVALAAVCACGVSIVWFVRPWSRALAGLVAGAAGAALPLGAWCVRNLFVHDYFGLTLFGGMSLLGVSGQLVDLESPLRAEEKAHIREAVIAYRAMDDLDRINWVLRAPDGICAQFDHYPARERDALFSDLAREAILHSPLRFAYSVLYRGRQYLLPHYEPTFPVPLAAEGEEARFWRSMSQPDYVAGLTANVGPSWGARLDASRIADRALRIVQAAVYPLFMVLSPLGLGLLVLRRRAPEIWTPALVAWSILALTALANVGLQRYLVPVTPLLVMAVVGALGGSGRGTPPDI